MIEWVYCFVPETSSFGCVQAVFGGVLDQLEVQMATDLFWKYMELSTQNAVRREDPLTWLCQFFESFRWPQFGTGYSSLFHAFQIFSETSHVSIIFEYIWYICLEPLWICHKSKGMVQAVETVLHCFNMFQHVPLLAKVAEAQLAWSGWQWDHQLWWNRPIRASAFPRKSRNFLS